MRERLALNVMMLVGRAFRNPEKGIAAVDLSSRLNIPAIAIAPVIDALEQAGLLLTTEDEKLFPGQELSRLTLNDILKVVREEGETGSYREPTWTAKIDALGSELDHAVSAVVGERTLANLLDELEQT
jgi:DNA-binding IscR family transcriptional regulator